MKGLLRHPDFLALSFLLLLVLLFLWQGILGGKALLPADALFSFLPWRPYATQLGVGTPHNQLIADMVLQNYGWKELIRSTLLQGQLPLWNPYVFTGMPLLAAGQGAALYPPSALLFTLLPIAQAYVWFTALHLFLGGLFTYFYLRVIGAGRWGALLAAAGFSLSGFLIVSFQWPQMVSAAIWLPFLLACLEQVFRRAERRPPATRQEAWDQWLGMPFWTIAGAIGVGLQFLAGHLEISLYILFMLLAYTVVRLGLMAREQGLSWDVAKAAGATGLMMVLGAALAGAQLVPFYELVQQNFRAGGATFQQVTGLGLPARQLIAFFIPDFFGNPTHHSYFDVVQGQVLPITGATDLAGQPRAYPFWGVKDYVEGAAYVGLLPLMLAGVALLLRRDRYTAFFAGYGAFALLLAFGTPLYALFFFGVPGYDQLHSPFRWVYPYSFCVVVLAGLGADTLLRDVHRSGGPRAGACLSGRQVRLRRWLGPGAAAAGVLVLLTLLASRLALSASLGFTQSLIARSQALAAAFSSPEALYSYQFRNLLVFGGLLLLSGVALTVALRRSRRGALGPALLLGVLTMDLVAFGWGFIAFTDARLVTFVPPALRWLQKDQEPFRIATYGPGDLLPPNSGMLAGVQDIRGYDSIIPRQYVELWRLLEEPSTLRYNRLEGLTQPAALASPLLDLMNVKYVLTSQPLEQEGFTRVYQGEVYIYRNEDVLPRAFAVFEARPAADQAQARQLVADPGFDPRRTVVLEAYTAPLRSGTTTARMQAADILRYEPNRVVARVTMSQEGYLVLSDAFFPGWRARDQQGRNLPVLRADANFRAVPLGPGDHTVTFTYFPDSFKLGLYVSFLGAVVCLLTAGYWGWRRFYREAAETSAVRRVAKNSLTPMTAQALARTVDFGFAIFMLRLLGPTNYGSYAFAVALIGYFAILTDYGLGTLLTREVARDHSQASRYVSNSIAMRLALCVALAPLLLALAWFYHWRFGLPVEAVIAAGLFMASLVPSSVAGVLSAVFSAHEKMEYQALVNVATTVLRAALGIAVLLLGWGIIGLGAVSVATSTVTALVFFFLVTRIFFRPSMAVEPIFGKGLVRTATPLMLNNLLNSVFFRVDMMLIQPMRGIEAVGYYSTAYKFIEGLLMIPAFFTLALFPVLSRYAQTSRELLMRAYTRALKVLILVALPITVAITVTAEQLILLFFGEAYAPAVRALQILIWFLPFSYANGVTQYVLIAVNQQRYLTGAFILGTSFNFIANLLVIPAYGIEGAAVVTILSEMVLLAPFMRGIYRYVGPLPLGSLGLSAVVAAAAMGAFLLLLRQYPFWIVVPLGMTLYLGALFILRVFDEEDRAILRSLLAR